MHLIPLKNLIDTSAEYQVAITEDKTKIGEYFIALWAGNNLIRKTNITVVGLNIDVIMMRLKCCATLAQVFTIFEQINTPVPRHLTQIDLDEIHAVGDVRPKGHWVALEPETNRKEKTMTEKSLYQVIAAPKKFGTLLTRSSNGELVLEMKGSGKVESFPASELAEVLPYTVDVNYKAGDGKAYAFFAKEADDWKIGDLLLSSEGVMLTVAGVDTKSRQAIKWLTGNKLVTTVITGE